MSRARRTNGTTSRLANADRTHDVLSLGSQRDDLAFYVRHKLSREERLVVMLRYAEQLAFDEIAGIMSMPQEQVESIHDKIVARLQRTVKTTRRSSQELCLAGTSR